MQKSIPPFEHHVVLNVGKYVPSQVLLPFCALPSLQKVFPCGDMVHCGVIGVEMVQFLEYKTCDGV